MGSKKKRLGARRIRKVDVRKALFVLPNLVTMASVFCGFNAMIVVARDNPTTDDFFRAAILLTFSMLFDLLDGRVARMTRTQSAFGLQLDSLADVMSFGAAPSLLMYKWVLYNLQGGAFIAFFFTACGAARLARFNVLSSGDSGTPVAPGKYVTGLPIPPAAGVLISLLLANHAVGGALGAPENALAFAVVTAVLSLLMVSNIKFRSFKQVKFSMSTAIFVLFALGSSALVWRYSKPQFVLVWLLAFYVFIGLFEALRSLAKGRPAQPSTPVPPPTQPTTDATAE